MTFLLCKSLMLFLPSQKMLRVAARCLGRSLYSLPELSYKIADGLLPAISAENLDLHFNKHHQTYVNNANNQSKGTEWENAKLEDAVKGVDRPSGLFNQVAQIWNHTFYFTGMTPGGCAPTAEVEAKLASVYGSFDEFKAQFSASAVGLFGSGWTWLVADGEGFKIVNTSNAETPLADGMTPILTCDVWEHAYYPTSQNRRPEYVENFWSVVDWSMIEQRMREAELL
jgi:Fe-Mn family superoxide dismutase